MKEYNTHLNKIIFEKILHLAKNGNAIASITAFRNDLSLQKNKNRNDKLEARLRSAGYGFNKIVGHYVSDEHNSFQIEYFLIIDNSSPEKLKNFTIKCGRYFEQDIIFFRSIEGKNTFIYRDGREEILESEFSPNSLLQFYSKMKCKPYIFEHISEYIEHYRGMGGAMARAKYDKIIEGTYEDFEDFLNS